MTVLARAKAEVAAADYAAASRSLKTCLELKQGSESEVWLVTELAKCCAALNQRADAIEWYRRAFKLNNFDPASVFSFLLLVVQETGADGVLKELPDLLKLRERYDFRLNATLSCFEAWSAASKGDMNKALRSATKAGPYFGLAVKANIATEDETVTWSVMLHDVYSQLNDAESASGFGKMLDTFPAPKVKAMQGLFKSAPGESSK